MQVTKIGSTMAAYLIGRDVPGAGTAYLPRRIVGLVSRRDVLALGQFDDCIHHQGVWTLAR